MVLINGYPARTPQPVHGEINQRVIVYLAKFLENVYETVRRIIANHWYKILLSLYYPVLLFKPQL